MLYQSLQSDDGVNVEENTDYEEDGEFILDVTTVCTLHQVLIDSVGNGDVVSAL